MVDAISMISTGVHFSIGNTERMGCDGFVFFGAVGFVGD